MTLLEQKKAKHGAFNRGYLDAVNNRERNYAGIPLEHLFYYDAGYDEGYPKRMVDTYVMTRTGPIKEKCSLERAAALHAANFYTPGGRR